MKNKYLFGVIGLVIGFAISFFGVRSYNRNNVNVSAASAQGGAMSGGGGGGNQQAMMAQVQQTLEKAKNNPKDYQAQIDAARVYYNIGRANETIEYLKKAYEIDSSSVGVSATIGQIYHELKNYPEAETWYRRATEAKDVSPSDKADLYVEIAATLIQRDSPAPDKALQDLQRALDLKPKNPHALSHLVEAYLLKKDARSAEDALNRLKEADAKSDKISSLQNLIADVKAGRSITIPKE